MTMTDASTYVPRVRHLRPGLLLTALLVALVLAAGALGRALVIATDRPERVAITSGGTSAAAGAAVDEAIARDFPVIKGAALPDDAVTPAIVERGIAPGRYRYEVSALTAEISDAAGRVLAPAELSQPSAFDVMVDDDGAWRADEVAGPRPSDQRLSLRFDGTVNEIWAGEGLVFRAVENVAGPTEDFSRIAAGAVLYQITGDREAAASAGRATDVTVESVECPAGTCVHVSSFRALGEAEMADRLESLPKREGADIERSDVVYDPTSGLIYLHQTRLNDALTFEFRLTKYA